MSEIEWSGRERILWHECEVNKARAEAAEGERDAAVAALELLADAQVEESFRQDNLFLPFEPDLRTREQRRSAVYENLAEALPDHAAALRRLAERGGVE